MKSTRMMKYSIPGSGTGVRMTNSTINLDFIQTNNNSKPTSLVAENNFQAWQKKLESARWWVSKQSKTSEPINKHFSNAQANSDSSRAGSSEVSTSIENKAVYKSNSSSALSKTGEPMRQYENVFSQTLNRQDLSNKFVFEKMFSDFKGTLNNNNKVSYPSDIKSQYLGYIIKDKQDESLRVYVSTDDSGIYINVVGKGDVSELKFSFVEQIAMFNRDNKKDIMSLRINGEQIYLNDKNTQVAENIINETELNRLY